MDQIRGRVAAGWLRRVHRGVFAIAGVELAPRGEWMAATLACGPGAALSHQAAAALLEVKPERPRLIDVTVPSRAGRLPGEGIRLHRPRRPVPVSRVDGIPVTTPARTLLDLAATGISRRALERAADEAERLGLCDARDLLSIATKNLMVPGSRRLRGLLAMHEVGSTLTRSELEERFLGLCRRKGLPPPSVNAALLGLTVDFLWPAARLVAELDGRASHETARAFQDDRDRDSKLTAAGFRVMRFTWWDVTRRPGLVATRLRRTLGSS